MQWIVWRQYRLNRTILMSGAALLIAPYVVSSILTWYDLNDLRLVENAAICSLCLSQLTLALLAGNAFAGERADRSAEFLVYLPIARSRRLLGKLILAGLTAGVIWGLNLLVIILPVVFADNQYFEFSLVEESLIICRHLREPCLDIGLTILVVFGVSWCLSAVQSSPVLAVCGGLLVPMLIIIVLLSVELNPPVQTQSIPYGPMPTHSTWDEKTWSLITCLILGLVCFSIGTWRERKRVEP